MHDNYNFYLWIYGSSYLNQVDHLHGIINLKYPEEGFQVDIKK